MKKLLVILCIILFVSCSTYHGEETNTDDLFKDGKLVDAYHYCRAFGDNVHVLVFKNDSMIIEKRVSIGVYYTYHKYGEHEGFVIK